MAELGPRRRRRRSKKKEGSSYTYLGKGSRANATPLPVPKKLSPDDILSNKSQPATLSAVWNRAGTWEEKSLNKWASDRIKLLTSTGSVKFSGSKTEITEVSNCVCDVICKIDGVEDHIFGRRNV